MTLTTIFRVLPVAMLVLFGANEAGAASKSDPKSALPSADVNSCMNSCWMTYASCSSSYTYTDCTDPYNQCVAYCRGYYDASRNAKPMPGPKPPETKP